MKNFRLVDIFPMTYHFHQSDEWFGKNHKKTPAATRRPPHHFQNEIKTVRNLKIISTYESCASSVAFQWRIKHLLSTNG